MKKIICIALCMVCMVAATGCGKKSLVNTEPPKENVSESVEESGEDVWVEEKEDVAEVASVDKDIITIDDPGTVDGSATFTITVYPSSGDNEATT